MRNLKNQIRLFKPSVGKEEINSFKEILKGPWLGYGSKVKEFETKFSKFIGVKYTIVTKFMHCCFTYCSCSQ